MTWNRNCDFIHPPMPIAEYKITDNTGTGIRGNGEGKETNANTDIMTET